MEIRRTWITQPVKEVMLEVWDYLTDDAAFPKESFEPRFDDKSRWYVAWDGARPMAAFWMEQKNLVTWEVHAHVRPSYWGRGNGTKICKETLPVVLEETGCKKLLALVPDCCPQVQKTAEAIGFEVEGVQKKSWLKDGVLYDQKYYGMTGV